MNQHLCSRRFESGFLSFNSLYLGFLHESLWLGILAVKVICTFNSLYLGFLHESATGRCCLTWITTASFNSLYLGFLHESTERIRAARQATSFQFPLLGISPWISSPYLDSNVANYIFQFPLLGISPWIGAIHAIGHEIMAFNSLYLGFLHESKC